MEVPIFLAAITLAVATSAAAPSEDLWWCRNGLFPDEQSTFGAGRVIGAGKIYFQEDSDGCPNDEKRCLEAGYVVPGDRLIVGRAHGKFVCAFHPDRLGGWAGWVPRDRLRLELAEKPLPPQAWAGRWKNGDDWLQLSVSGDRLTARGKAYWPALNVAPAHTGRFSGAAPFHNGRITIRDGNDSSPGDCTVTMQRVGPWLLVSDNQRCGGLNVSFTGVYRRR